MDAKKWYQSTTIWVAILQTLAGFISGTINWLQHGPQEVTLATYGAGVKGLYDLKMRLETGTPIQGTQVAVVAQAVQDIKIAQVQQDATNQQVIVDSAAIQADKVAL